MEKGKIKNTIDFEDWQKWSFSGGLLIGFDLFYGDCFFLSDCFLFVFILFYY